MKKIALLLLPILIFVSCGKELETVTVRPDQSDLFAAPDSLSDTRDSDEFIHFRVGEVAPIESLDPLYATSNSEWRIINLLYEGLVDLNAQGNIVPAIARSWQVNKDSTQFTFRLNSNKRFHASPVFEGNNGRLIKASDVGYVFERMASDDVPPLVAYDFIDIRGFKAFQAERELIKNPEKWAYESIEGIRIQNDSTITFNFLKPAPDFLERLSHPMASVYAEESVKDSQKPIQQAAGTGSYRYIRKENGAFMLTMVPGEMNSDLPRVNRLDIYSGGTEQELYQLFARENLDAIVELGPSTYITVTDSTGQFLDGFYRSYTLTNTGVISEYPIYYNMESENRAMVSAVLQDMRENDVVDNPPMGSLFIKSPDTIDGMDYSAVSGQLVITHTNHPFRLYMLNKMATKATEKNLSFSMNASYATWPAISLSHYPYAGTEEILRWDAPIYILSRNDRINITFQSKPWDMIISADKSAGQN